MKSKEYNSELRILRVELVKLQEWIKKEGLKVAVLFEGRDAAGKGGVIKRITEPLSKFGASFRLRNNYSLPLIVRGSQKLKSISFFEDKGSAQCKSSVIFGGIKADGKTIIKAKKSRNHTELLFKHLKLPIKVKRNQKFDLIEVNKVNKINPINSSISHNISPKLNLIISD